VNQESSNPPQNGSPEPLPVSQELPQAEPVPVVPPASNDVADNKDIAALGYVWILSIFVLFYRHQSPFARFHAVQGTVLFIISIAAWLLPGFIGRLIGLVVLGMCVWGFMSAAQGKWKQLPLIYALAHGDMKALRDNWKSIVNHAAMLWHRVRNRAGKKQDAGAESAPDTLPPTPPLV